MCLLISSSNTVIDILLFDNIYMDYTNDFFKIIHIVHISDFFFFNLVIDQSK